MGQIANQMALELIYKLKEKLTNKEAISKKKKVIQRKRNNDIRNRTFIIKGNDRSGL